MCFPQNTLIPVGIDVFKHTLKSDLISMEMALHVILFLKSVFFTNLYLNM